jgi:hypothetical protein
MFRAPILLASLLLALLSTAQHLRHYVAAVQGMETTSQEQELLHYLRNRDPGGRYVIDTGTGDVNIHTSQFVSESAFQAAVNSFGLLLLHFQEVQPQALPRRKRNQRSA